MAERAEGRQGAQQRHVLRALLGEAETGVERDGGGRDAGGQRGVAGGGKLGQDIARRSS
ncbi:unnamed protein product [Acidocella sp. C78]|nr:unnamed protein product [Acidocella sp. C78]